MSYTSPGRILPIIGWDLSQHNGWEAGFDRSRSICPRLRNTRSIKKLIFQPPLTTWLKRQKLVLVPQITLDSNHSWPPQWVYSLLTKTHARVYGNRRSNTAINKVSSIISTISWFQTIPHSHTLRFILILASHLSQGLPEHILLVGCWNFTSVSIIFSFQLNLLPTSVFYM